MDEKRWTLDVGCLIEMQYAVICILLTYSMNAYITQVSYHIFTTLEIILFIFVHPLKMDKIYHPTPPQKTPLKSHWPQRSEV
jgi:hypothetical protein